MCIIWKKSKSQDLEKEPGYKNTLECRQNIRRIVSLFDPDESDEFKHGYLSRQDFQRNLMALGQERFDHA